MPATRKFGFECEVAGGASQVVALLHEKGLTADNRLHHYHCSCPTCRPDRTHYNIHGQQDCTADGEFITRILTYGTPEAEQTIDGLADALFMARATVGTGQGFHVHVDKRDLSHAARGRLWRLFVKYQQDLGRFANGQFSDVRTYNGPLRYFRQFTTLSEDQFWSQRNLTRVGRACGHSADLYTRSFWLNDDNANTYEFRLWNSTRVAWRMHLAVGISVALVQAAKDGVKVNPDDERTLLDVCAPYLTDDTLSSAIRHLTVKEVA
jgi:hypothetical protein